MREVGAVRRAAAGRDDGPWSVCFSLTLVLVFAVTSLFPSAVTEGAQAPPIGIALQAQPGWEETPSAAPTAAAVLKRRGADGRVIAVLNVVISESAKPTKASIVDEGVADGLERELLLAVPGARARSKSYCKVSGFNALSVVVDIMLDGKPKVLRQTTVDVQRGAVTITVVADADRGPELLGEADKILEGLVIDAAH